MTVNTTVQNSKHYTVYALKHISCSSKVEQTHHLANEIKLTAHFWVQVPLDEQMRYQHNNIDVHLYLVYMR